MLNIRKKKREAMGPSLKRKQYRVFSERKTGKGLKLLIIGLAISGVMFVFYGCGTVPVNLHYQPASATQPLAAGIITGIYIDRIIDNTGGPDSYGGNINEQLGLKGPLSTTILTPYTESLKQSLQVELARLGIPVVNQREKAVAILGVTLTKTLAYVKSTGMTDVPVYGAFEFSLSLKCSDGAPVWEGYINGYGQGLLSAPGYLRVGSGPNDAMNAALANAMEQIGPIWKSDNVLAILSQKCRKNS